MAGRELNELTEEQKQELAIFLDGIQHGIEVSKKLINSEHFLEDLETEALTKFKELYSEKEYA